jgi:disulfide bond formation protein DsbB
MATSRLFAPTPAALLLFTAAAATIVGALVFQYGLGYRPCALCLTQRWPYYAAMPLALAAALLPRRVAGIALALLAFLFLVSLGLGLHHAGVEWGFWPGPADCGGAPATSSGRVQDLLGEIERTPVVDCRQAAWRFLGLSLAGWNAAISLALAGLAMVAARRALRPA